MKEKEKSSFVQKLWDNSLGLLFREEAAAAGAGGLNPWRGRSGDAASQSDLKRLADLLEKALAGQGVATAGAVYFINLDGVREHFGDRWPKVADRVQRVVRAAIERRLTDDDLYMAAEDLTYVLVFGSTARAQAELRCGLIAEEIQKRVVGNAAPGEPQFEVRTAVADLDKKSFQEFSAGNIANQLMTSAKSGFYVGAGTPVKPVAAARRGRPAPAAANGVPDYLATGPQVQWRTRPGRGVTLRDRLQAGSDAEPGPKDEPKAPAWTPQFIYRPMWDVKRKLVTSFLCLPAAMAAGQRLLVGHEVLQTGRVKDLTALDLAVLQRTVDDTAALTRDRRLMLITVCVHYPTLANLAARERFLDLCRQFGERERRYVIFEMANLPDGVPAGRVADLSAFLKPFSRSVVARLPIDHADFTIFRDSRVFAAGVDLWRTKLSQATLIEKLPQFAERANRQGLRTYVHGLSSTAMATAAITAGFDYVDGDAVATIADTPSDAYPFTVENLYASILGEEENP